MPTLPYPFDCEKLNAGYKKFRRDLKNVNADLVLFLHEEAEEHPKGSDERLASLEFAHQIYLEGRRKRRGRPKKEEGAFDGDVSALAYMDFLSQKTGETCARKLARAVVDEVPNAVSEESRIRRLTRKYTKRLGTREFPHGPGWGSSPDDDDDPLTADDI